MPFFNRSQMGSRQGFGAWPGMQGQQAPAAPSMWNRMQGQPGPAAPSMWDRMQGQPNIAPPQPMQQVPMQPMQPGGFGSTPGITQMQPPPMQPGGFGSIPAMQPGGGMMNGGGPSVLPPAPNMQSGIVDDPQGFKMKLHQQRNLGFGQGGLQRYNGGMVN